nr:YaiI/YqxD family protein [Desulfobulbaceae bacterium]
MKIWVDADACPAVIKDILCKAAERTGVQLTLVANHFMRVPQSRVVGFLKVTAGLDVADNEIVKRVAINDLVVTSDIPLAAKVVDQGAIALNPRGELYTAENVRDRLSMRDFMDSLRGSGIDTGGPSALSQNDRKQFAGQLDKILTKYLSQKGDGSAEL